MYLCCYSFTSLNLLILINFSRQVIFLRTIEAVGFPYYKILMSLGECKESIVFFERKVWPQLRLNRVFDIYYKSNKPDSLVSRVELRLVVNDTGCQAYSINGVGFQEFAATLFTPTNLGPIFSTLTIFTCSKGKFNNSTKEDDVQLLPFYVNTLLNNDRNYQ